MSVTAVPLRAISKGSLARLWLGVGAVVLAAGGLAYAGQRGVTPSSAAFLTQNGKEAGIITTASGLQYKVVKEGQGPSPSAGDIALVGYTGTLLDGTVFDQNEQTAMPVDGVVPGFSEGLRLMKRGGEYKLFLPPALAYGDKAPEGGPIPPNAVLIFDVKLLDFKSRAEIMAMQQQMQQMQMQGAHP
ncbi:MAG: FKBP-type peptidyl-prolyl cis-trans isomerase [Sphingobium sp.]|nr:FKBP-type peptidyl-prolyl cis-trans isomerase [Sphingobium sp.]MBP6111082.1 FKBP-type peptidyl-prolyl cis-trans isomerase [Sphingobium sp.]MBP8672306.1 FKBP-type peptidyl-prolyl cis-trans isomerase [Sphingobium sp.]MBP9157945.1 FKBP-type peptidyl-prolyl cis-trans isomerase [Sphingobium sp.]MCC6482030.1 FKBP-type peptidyl-prolyl cis-trans isomerase [Sphingomonadaceae bacterium]